MGTYLSRYVAGMEASRSACRQVEHGSVSRNISSFKQNKASINFDQRDPSAERASINFDQRHPKTNKYTIIFE